MIAGLDSAFPPSPDAALAAKADGVKLWSGYLSSAPYDGWSHFGLYHPWPPEGFEYARLCGSTPIAFCSGWDDPRALKALADGWGLRLCLDVESGIRPDGAWVQPWLDASGAGLYGNAPVHRGRRAAFYILAAYPGYDPSASWSGARPNGPCAWQWQGTHTEFGVGVDRGAYDDWFGGLHGGGAGALGEEMDPQVLAQLMYLAGLGRVAAGNGADGKPEQQWLVDAITKNPSDVGATLGVVVNSTEGKAWAATLAKVRAGTLTGAQGPAGPPGPPGKDGVPGKDGSTPTTGTIAGPIKVTLA